MYFKSQNQNANIRVPLGYKGNAFPAPKPAKPIDTKGKSISEPIIIPEEPQKNEPPILPCESCKMQQEIKIQEPQEEKNKSVSSGIFGFDGGLEAEELLILALALIVFQGGKENELALLLLALLFIK